jgi:iron complex outermembrane receptor protein
MYSHTSIVFFASLLQAPDSLPRRAPDTLETVVVRATRTSGAPPTSQTTLDRATIERRSAGQDAPLVLRGLTAVTVSSDAGAYSGYSYLRLRGIDQTRLAISLDGVPLNDPEDQVLYFSNVPDFMNSIQSVRVQRGVGSSAFGTAAFGGSLNFESIPIASTPRFGEVQATAGSWGTGRVSAEGATGLTRGWAGYGRVSAQTTDGYRYHSGNSARSGFLSAGWIGGRDAVKLVGFAGRSKTQLAYLAAPEAQLAVDRRINPMSPAERDDFHQEMVSLQYTRAVSPAALITATGYRHSAGGDYDVAVGSELWNFNLDHEWYGALSTLSWRGERTTLTAGAHLTRYARDHFLFVRPDLESRIYDNTGYKSEQSLFLKGSWAAGAVTVHGDLEVRRAAFRYRPTPGSTLGEPSIDWVFLNPKVGLTWRAGTEVSTHLSLGRTRREPTRSDMFAGADDLDPSSASELLPLDRVRPESVADLEAGAEWSRGGNAIRVNGFLMNFRDEIAPIGALSIIGTPLRRNVDRSYRTGVELEWNWVPRPRLELGGNATVMRARIREVTNEATGVTYRNVPPVLSPGLVANLQAAWRPGQGELSAALRHVSESQLANDGDPALVTPAFTILDLGAGWSFGRLGVRVHAENVTGSRAFASGYTDGTTRFLYPIASRTLLGTVTIRL